MLNPGVSSTAAFFYINILGILLRSVCFPMIYQDDDNWKERLDEELKVHEKNFEEITEIMKNTLNNLQENRVSNAYQALNNLLENDKLLEKPWTYYTSCKLMYYSHVFLTFNFTVGAYDDDKEFKVVIVESTNVHYLSPNLFYYSNSDYRSMVVGLGKLWPKYRCDEENELVRENLTCFKIGDSYISYHGDNVESCGSNKPWYRHSIGT